MLKLFILATTCVFLSGCIGTATLISCAADASSEPKPSVIYGEFPFQLDYEVDGDSSVINDAVVCNYEGRACNGRGLYNDWSRKLKSGSEGIVLKKLSSSERIMSPLASCRQLMHGNIPKVSNSAVIERTEGTMTGWGRVAPEELATIYGIKLTKHYVTKKP